MYYGKSSEHHDRVVTSDASSERPRLRLLLDSNIVVAAEPYAGNIEANMSLAAQLLRLANELGHVLCVAPATCDDVLENLDPARRRQRVAELDKFTQLEEVPLTQDLRDRAGDSLPGTNNHRDLRLLATLNAGAVNYLVTEDGRLRRRARRAGLGDFTLSLAEAVELLTGFVTPLTPTPPSVDRCAAYALDPDQPIFDSLREDYPEFDHWLAKVRRDSDNRTCFLIRHGGRYAAVALLKFERDSDYELAEPVIKISTFKVSPAHVQVKFGELLLKAIFAEAYEHSAGSLYLEVFEKHEGLIGLLSNFGFGDSGARTGRGETVMVKRLQATDADRSLPDLDYHVRLGPPALLMRQSAFAVPIWPGWHNQLFPERTPVSQQLSLFPPPPTHPWGNALRKAYLCNSPSTRIAPGDVLFFYRSGGAKSIAAVGIVENTQRSSDPAEIAAFVGTRTVYTLDEISVMCRSVRGVLAIRFRQDRFLEPELTLDELMFTGVLTAHPQSITRIPEGSIEWLRTRLRGQH